MTDKLALSRRGLLAASAAFATVSLSGAASAAPVRGGKLIFARYTDSQQLDPVKTELNADIWVMNSIYETLLLPTSDGLGVQPGLATKWGFTDGGKGFAITLREGVMFSDGTPCTAEDVKWSLDRARDPKGGPWADMVGSITDVAITSPTTIALKLKNPDPTLIAALSMFSTAVMSKKAYDAAAGNTPDEKSAKLAEHPIGTGPFKMVDWKRGEIMRLARNEHYWRKAPDGKPLPYVDTLDFPVIPDDATRILKLRAGEVHGCEFIPYARVKELKADPKLRMELWPSTKVVYNQFNVRPEYNGKKNPLADVRVRQALNHAVDKKALIAITTQGLGTPMSSYMSSVTPMHVGSGPVFPYDVAKAKKLLADAGYPGGGFEIVAHALSGNVDDTNNYTTIQQMWAAVGVKLTIEQMDYATKTARYKKGDYQMRSALWTDDIADPSEITSYFAYSPTTDCLHTGYKNEKVDALYKQSQEEVDIPKRKALYAELQKIFNAEGPLMPMYEVGYPVAWLKDVKGFVQIPLGNNYFEAVALKS